MKTLHEVKWRKQNNQLKVELAREEVKQRERNKKEKQAQTRQTLKINKLKLQEVDKLLDEIIPPPIITIQIGNEQIIMQALIDTGSDCNTISKDLFAQQEGIALLPTNAILRSVIAHTTKPRGICNLMVHVDELSCGDKFFVT